MVQCIKMELQEIAIKWDDHKSEIIREQQNLFKSNVECDCILVSAQGNQILAHQIILASSSDFFRDILQNLPPLTGPAVIHIPDAETFVLEAILEFIYTGKTSISSVNIATLLEFCNFLDIKGCVGTAFAMNDPNVKSVKKIAEKTDAVKPIKNSNSSSESWSSEEYLEIPQALIINSENDDDETDYLEEYLDDDVLDGQVLVDNDDDDERIETGDGTECFEFEIEKSVETVQNELPGIKTEVIEPGKRQRIRQGPRSTNSQIDKALNEVNTGKTIHRLSVEYNLPRSTLYHRFRNNENLKQNYRLERKSSLDNAVRAVLNERLSLKMAADRFKVPKTAIWREVRKCEQYQPSNKEITEERQEAQREILSGKSLTSISTKYGKFLH